MAPARMLKTIGIGPVMVARSKKEDCRRGAPAAHGDDIRRENA
jgi:hypothetical protein